MDSGLPIQQNSVEQWKIKKPNIHIYWHEYISQTMWMKNVAKRHIQDTIFYMLKWKINALWINIHIEKYKNMPGNDTHAHAYKLQDHHYLRGKRKGKWVRLGLYQYFIWDLKQIL